MPTFRFQVNTCLIHRPVIPGAIEKTAFVFDPFYAGGIIIIRRKKMKMFKYCKFVLAPAVVIIILVNCFLPDPSRKDIKKYISKAIASGNDRVACKEYENLVKSDVNDIELHRAYIGQIERGEKNIGLLNLKKIADALGVKAKDLVKNV